MVCLIGACGGVSDPSSGESDSSVDASSVWNDAQTDSGDGWAGDEPGDASPTADSRAADAVLSEASATDSAASDAAQDATIRDGGEDSTSAYDAAPTHDATSIQDAAVLDSATTDAEDERAPQDGSMDADSGILPDVICGGVICAIGSHFDPTVCKCVPGACISEEGGTCGGFTSNPCQCAAGLTCVPNSIPDIPGTCEPPHVVCDPIACGPGQTWDSTLCECTPPACMTALDCKGALPQICLVCVDGSTGCAHWTCSVGTCEVAYCP